MSDGAIANVLTFGLLLLAAVSALIALWQAGVASRARADAQEASAAAAAHEEAALEASRDAASAAARSADEAKRTADALVEANELVRSQLAPRPLWIVAERGGDEYSLVSNMVGVAQWVSLTAWRNPGVISVHEQQPVELLRFGEALQFRRERRLSATGAITLLVEWQDIDFNHLSVQIHLP